MVSELDDLRRKLKARKGRPGFKANVAELEARIAELENVEAGND
jgi:exonuclease VII small subunit